MSFHDDEKKKRGGRVNADYNRDSYSWNSTTIRKNFQQWKDENGTFNEPFSHRLRSRLRYFYSLAEMELGVYLNHGAQKALNAYLLGRRTWHTRYMIGFAEINVDLTGRDAHVKIIANDSFYFEFASSGKPIVTETVTQLSSSIDTYKGVMVGVNVSVKHGALSYSSEIRNGTRDVYGFNSIIERGYQVNLINEPVAYPQGERQLNRLRYPVTLYESWAPGMPHTGVHYRNTSWAYDVSRVGELFTGGWQQYWLYSMFRTRQRGAHWPHAIRDVNYDVPFQTQRDFVPVNPVILRGGADWPRATGLQSVTSAEWGTREFAIYVDAFNQFFVFPTAAATAWTGDYLQNVDSLYVQQATYSMPAWVHAPTSLIRTYFTTLAKWLVDFPELDWKAHPDGTKFASVVYERSPFDFDSAYFTTPPLGTIPFTSTEFAVLRDELGVTGRWGERSYHTTTPTQRYFAGTGIIELDVAIELTGPDLEDYTVVATVREVRRPTTSEECTFAVDYIARDFPPGSTEETRIATKGEMVVMDVEQWAKDGVHFNPVKLVVIRKVDVATVLYSSSVPTQIMALDLASLSFVARIDRYVQDTQSKPVPSSSPMNVTMETLHFAMWAVIGLESKELLFPELMTADNQAYFTSLVSTAGYTGLDDVAAEGLYRVPLNESRDWTDADFADTRDYLSQPSQAKHLATGQSLTAGITATLTKWYWEWSDLNPAAYLIYCDAPKFGWHLYADVICGYIGLAPADVVFFVHPNGTWAYWDNTQIYNLNGACITGDLYTVDQITDWDTAKVEHCIFDRVHFEARTVDREIGSLDTTFLQMYNAAVRSTTAAGNMVDDVQEIAAADLRATFAKAATAFGIGSRTYLTVTATWDSGVFDLREYGVQAGTAGSTFAIADTLLSIEMSMIGLWITPPPGPFFAADPTSGFHARFSNPLLLDGVRENN